MKKILKKFIPPICIDIIKSSTRRKYGWFGHYENWNDAKKNSSGYGDNKILQKVRSSLLKVKKGEAVYERDSVIFSKIHYSWSFLSSLMFACAKSEGRIGVLDFGGSLGSTYFQNKKFLDRLKNVSWNIVEQSNFVDVGKKEFEDKRLHFYYNIDNCIKEERPNILLFSSVLQYIEKPYELLNRLTKRNFDFILIDRTPFSKNGKDRIALQKVPPQIYNASYPCHIFNEQKFIDYFKNKNYKLIEEFNSLDGENKDCKFKGYILEKALYDN